MHLSSVDTLILCGGKGLRLKSANPKKPKVLADINGEPFLKYLLDYLEKQGIKKSILCTGYMHELVYKWINNDYDGQIKITFSQEKVAMGTGGSIKNALNKINSNPVIILNGDTLSGLNINKLIDFYFKNNMKICVAVSERKNTESKGIFIVKNNRIIKFTENPKNLIQKGSFFVNVGTYIMDKSVIATFPNKTPLSLESEVFPLLIKNYNNLFFGYKYKNEFIDIGIPETYFEINKIVKNKKNQNYL